MTAELNLPAERLPRRAKRPVPTQTIRVAVYLTQMVADTVAILVGFAIASAIRFGGLPRDDDVAALFTLVPLFLVVGFYSGAYSFEGITMRRRSIERVLTSLALATSFNVLAAFAIKEWSDMSRVLLFSGAAFSAVLLAAERAASAWIVRERLGDRFYRTVVVIDGAPADVPAEFHVIDLAEHNVTPDPNDPHALHHISGLLIGADRVLVSSVAERRENWSLFLKGIGCNGELLLPELRALDHIQSTNGTSLVGLPVSVGPLDIRSRVLKRCFDLALTVPAIILLTPLLVAVAIGVKLTSPGPVLFRQPRMGRGNRLFHVYKFRSMRVETSDENGSRSTARDDDRLTSFGRLIRRTSVDELPQLFNVLEGDMSLVGPRPHALGSLAGDELFWRIDRRYWLRHAIKPGITGLAQVRGFRGATDHRDDLTLRLQCDLEYVSSWSLMTDVAILFRTLAVIVHAKAY